jgi:hypothetical protein
MVGLATRKVAGRFASRYAGYTSITEALKAQVKNTNTRLGLPSVGDPQRAAASPAVHSPEL